MSADSRRVAGVLLVLFPTLVGGGASILTVLARVSAYIANAFRQDLWRAGHAHAGVMSLLALVMLRYVDEANLSAGLRWVARLSAPTAAILLPLALFFSVLTPDAKVPIRFIYLAYVGAAVLALGLLVLGAGLLRKAVDCSGSRSTNW